jgi:hypothetical protein
MFCKETNKDGSKTSAEANKDVEEIKYWVFSIVLQPLGAMWIATSI